MSIIKLMGERKMKKTFLILLFTISLFHYFTIPLFHCFPVPSLQAEITFDYPTLLQRKMEMENEYRQRIQEILDRVIGPEKSRITGIQIELKLEKQETRREAAAGRTKEEKSYELGKEEYILPGVPAPRGLTPKEKPTAEEMEKAATGESKVVIPTLINKIRIALAIDEKIPDEKIVKVRDLLVDSLALDFKRGDEIKITKIAFSQAIPPAMPTFWSKFLDNPYLVFLAFLTLLLLFFLFGPLTRFLRNLTEAMRESRGTEVTVQGRTEAVAGPGGGGGGVGGGGILGVGGEWGLEIGKKEKAEEIKKEKPFSFINKENLKNLIYLLQEETPETISLVLNELDAELSGEVFASLPAEIQMRVALCLAGVKLTSEEDVRRVEQEIKKKIDFLVGGIDSFLQILDQVDNATRKEMLAALEQESPKLAQKARERIFLFEDISKLSDPAIQFLLREMRIEDLAIALRGTVSPEVTNKFFANMSEGGKALLKEEMEFGRPVTPERIEEEQRLTEKIVRKMAEEGKIVLFRPEEKKKRGIELEGRLEKLQLGSEKKEEKNKVEEKPDPEKAIEYYNSGLKEYQNGQIDSAVVKLQRAIFHNPQLWQAYQLLGNCYYSRGMVKEAFSAYEQALNLNPTNQELRDWLTLQKTRLTRV